MTTERAEHNVARVPDASAALPGPAIKKPGPHGIGTAVAFDWGLTVQFLLEALLVALGVGPGAMLASSPTAVRLLAAAVSIGFAAIIWTLGESVRRGRRLAWIVQIVINALIFLVGFALIPGAIRSLSKGHVGDLVPALIMLIASPLAAVLLTRKSTRAWIAR